MFGEANSNLDLLRRSSVCVVILILLAPNGVVYKELRISTPGINYRQNMG